jgi:transcriptional regulator with XRE-family HTH domain
VLRHPSPQPLAASFAELLRRLRTAACLAKEELAEAAGLSSRSVSDLERDVSRTARKETARLLADALAMAGPVRSAFIAAARGKAPGSDVLATDAAASRPPSGACYIPLAMIFGSPAVLAC